MGWVRVNGDRDSRNKVLGEVSEIKSYQDIDIKTPFSVIRNGARVC